MQHKMHLTPVARHVMFRHEILKLPELLWLGHAKASVSKAQSREGANKTDTFKQLTGSKESSAPVVMHINTRTDVQITDTRSISLVGSPMSINRYFYIEMIRP